MNGLYVFLTIVFVLAITFAGTLVYYSLTFPIDRLPDDAKSNLTAANIADGTFTAVLKDVLPFATALVGFAAGLASAVFSVTAKDKDATKSASSNGAPNLEQIDLDKMNKQQLQDLEKRISAKKSTMP